MAKRKFDLLFYFNNSANDVSRMWMYVWKSRHQIPKARIEDSYSTNAHLNYLRFIFSHNVQAMIRNKCHVNRLVTNKRSISFRKCISNRFFVALAEIVTDLSSEPICRSTWQCQVLEKTAHWEKCMRKTGIYMQLQTTQRYGALQLSSRQELWNLNMFYRNGARGKNLKGLSLHPKS